MKSYAFAYKNADGKTALQEVRNVENLEEAKKYLKPFVKANLLPDKPYLLAENMPQTIFTRPYPIW